MQHSDNYDAVVTRLTPVNSSRVVRKGFRVVTRARLVEDGGFILAEGYAYLNEHDHDDSVLGDSIAIGRAEKQLARG